MPRRCRRRTRRPPVRYSGVPDAAHGNTCAHARQGMLASTSIVGTTSALGPESAAVRAPRDHAPDEADRLVPPRHAWSNYVSARCSGLRTSSRYRRRVRPANQVGQLAWPVHRHRIRVPVVNELRGNGDAHGKPSDLHGGGPHGPPPRVRCGVGRRRQPRGPPRSVPDQGRSRVAADTIEARSKGGVTMRRRSYVASRGTYRKQGRSVCRREAVGGRALKTCAGTGAGRSRPDRLPLAPPLSDGRPIR